MRSCAVFRVVSWQLLLRKLLDQNIHLPIVRAMNMITNYVSYLSQKCALNDWDDNIVKQTKDIGKLHDLHKTIPSYKDELMRLQESKMQIKTIQIVVVNEIGDKHTMAIYPHWKAIHIYTMAIAWNLCGPATTLRFEDVVIPRDTLIAHIGFHNGSVVELIQERAT